MGLKVERGKGKQKTHCKISIDGDMTIYAITALKNDIAEAIATSDKVEMNLSGVDEFDSAGIQLLIALNDELARTHKAFELVGQSDPVSQILDVYDMKNQFNGAENER